MRGFKVSLLNFTGSRVPLLNFQRSPRSEDLVPLLHHAQIFNLKFSMIETCRNITEVFRKILQNSLILLTSMLIFQRTFQFPSDMSFSLCNGIMINSTHTQEVNGKKEYHPYFSESLTWIPRNQTVVFLIFF